MKFDFSHVLYVVYIMSLKKKKKPNGHILKRIFLKHNVRSKACMCYSLQCEKIIINRNVKFDEMSSITHEKMKPNPMLWLVTNDLCH